MPRRPRTLSRRELMELAAAMGVATVLPGAALATPTAKPYSTEAELIGALLWASFKKGAGIPIDDPLPDGVEDKGRDLSGPKIDDNLQKCGGLEKFPFDRTMGCALKAGQMSKENAKNAHHDKIKPDDFEKAWKDVQHGMQQRLAKVKQKNDCEMIFGGAC